MSKSILLAGAVAAISLAVTTPAFAHAHLASAEPASGATVTVAPAELDLTFSEGVNLKFTGIKLAGPGKAATALGKPSLMEGDDTMLMVPVTGTLVPGTYTVTWHALSTDGHKTTGSYSFTLKP
jgi:methionine-rich copper-binding protein CopC